jgi:DNA-binding NarL/FixJ family response regulator
MMEPKTDTTIRVWLVEDNTMFAAGVGRVVDSLEGLSCDGCFTTVEAAFEALESGRVPDVILLDVQLPGLDGITALATFRERAPDAKVVILTVFDDAEKIFRAVCAGAAGYVLKSAGIDRIADAIRQVVDGGAPMSPAVARKVLDVFPKLQPTSGTHEDYQLTDRETDILRLLADGLQKKEIAMELDISTHTVSTHLRRVYSKLHVTTNTGAVAKALREGII